jgi:hypothetical protein
LDKARLACKNSGFDIDDHFVEVNKTIQMPKTASKRVIDEEYAVFQNAGYKGLYGGLDVEDIHKRKGLRDSDKILDFMGSEELAANLKKYLRLEC